MPETVQRTGTEFDAFFERHWKYVYRLCYVYMKDQAEAEDCAEDVFVKVLEDGRTFQDETHERKWLTVAAVNRCRDRLRSHARKVVGSVDDDMMPEIAAPDPGDEGDVLEQVMALPGRLKDVVLLHYVEGYRTDEIAAMLGRPPSTVRNQLKDARDLLRKHLGGDPF